MVIRINVFIEKQCNTTPSGAPPVFAARMASSSLTNAFRTLSIYPGSCSGGEGCKEIKPVQV